MSFKLSTPVQVAKGSFEISHQNAILLLGSCFSDAIGQRLLQSGFDVMCNPFGTIYNPASIHACMAKTLSGTSLCDDDMVQHNDVWHSWYHHSRFSHSDKDVCLQRCNDSFVSLRTFLARCDTVVITLGTAFVYLLGGMQGRVVANCHKLPAANFFHNMLSVDECCQLMTSEPMAHIFGARRVIFTVSPIRHLSSPHDNQLSKSTLLLAVDHLARQYALDYFPAYEILLDELRDYRYYDRDMLHPSPLAQDIIFDRFADAYFSPATRSLCIENEKRYRASLHRPNVI